MPRVYLLVLILAALAAGVVSGRHYADAVSAPVPVATVLRVPGPTGPDPDPFQE